MGEIIKIQVTIFADGATSWMVSPRFLFVGFVATLAAVAANPPVILISIDTLRADHLSAYGYRAIRTPNLDSFAEGGTLFVNADSQVPMTLPSHTSFLTSTYPFENRIEENAERVPGGAVTLATVLRSRGYKTAAFIGSVFLEREMGLDRGFDVYDSPFHFEAFEPISGTMFFGGASRSVNAGRDRRDGALVVRAAEQWMQANHGEPAFVFVHLFDMHKPYPAHASFPQRAGVSGYDTALEYVDSVLGGFKKWLQREGWWDRSLVVLLSDHGEGLDQHGESSHGYFIYESTLHVPLILHWPVGSAPLQARIERPSGLIDIAPTILDFLHIPAPASFEGASLLRDTDRPVYAESLHTHDSFGWAALRSLRSGDWKYIEAPHPELYNLQADPGERNNVVLKEPARAQKLRAELVKLLARFAPKTPASTSQISPQTRALLGSLGYLAAGPQSRVGGAAPDPKDRLPEFQLYEKAMVLVYGGRLPEAIAALTQVLATDPANTLARRDLGACYLDRQSYAKARAAFEQVIKTAPDDYMSQYELGVADEHLGLLIQAREHLEDACRISPDAAQCRQELDAVRLRTKQASGAGVH